MPLVAISQIFDKLGTRIGFTFSIGFWSIATQCMAFAKGVVSLSIFRSLLGISELGNWARSKQKENADGFQQGTSICTGITSIQVQLSGILPSLFIGCSSVPFQLAYIFHIGRCTGIMAIHGGLLVKSHLKKHPWDNNENGLHLNRTENQDADEDGDFCMKVNPLR